MDLKHAQKKLWKSKMVLIFMLLNLTEITRALWLVVQAGMNSEDLITLRVTCSGV